MVGWFDCQQDYTERISIKLGGRMECDKSKFNFAVDFGKGADSFSCLFSLTLQDTAYFY